MQLRGLPLVRGTATLCWLSDTPDPPTIIAAALLRDKRAWRSTRSAELAFWKSGSSLMDASETSSKPGDRLRFQSLVECMRPISVAPLTRAALDIARSGDKKKGRAREN